LAVTVATEAPTRRSFWSARPAGFPEFLPGRENPRSETRMIAQLAQDLLLVADVEVNR
jgi:hypothetical protein